MRRLPRPLPPALAALSLLTLATTGCAETGKPDPAAADPQPGDAVVELVGLEFAPSTIEVPLGRRVVWKWTDSVVHNVVSTDFASSKALNGGAYAIRFDRTGRFPYRCTLHTGMDGTVVVAP